MQKTKIQISCTPEEKELIRQKAKRCIMPMGEYCRHSALDLKVTEWFSPEQIQAYKMMMQYHDTLKEIAGMIQQDDPELSHVVLELVEKLETHLLNFSK